MDIFMISLLILWSPWTIIFMICLTFVWSPRLCSPCYLYDLHDIFMISWIFCMISLIFLCSPWYFHDLLVIFMISLTFLWSPWYFYDLPCYFHDLLDIFMISLIFLWSPLLAALTSVRAAGWERCDRYRNEDFPR